MADRLSPNAGVQVDAQGRVTYDFDGHVHARGLDLDAGTVFGVDDVFGVPGDNSIQWSQGAGGALVAKDFATVFDPYSYRYATLRPTAAAKGAELGLATVDPATGDFLASIALNRFTDASSPRDVISVGAGNASANLLDSNGRSSFPRADDERTRISGQRQVAIGGLAAGGYFEPLVDLPVANPAFFTVFGGFIPRDYMEFMRWAWAAENASQFRFRFWNNSSFVIPGGSFFTYHVIYGV